MCMVDNGVGSCSPYLRCVSMASSVISVKKSARQYHCRPSGSSGLNRLWKASNGIGARPTISGEPNSLIGASAWSATSWGPV